MSAAGENPLGFICSVPGELEALTRLLDGVAGGQEVGEFTVREGSLGGGSVAVVCCGCGKALAAAATQFLVDAYRPRAILNFGSAGSLAEYLGVGDVLLPTRLYQGDTGIVHGGGYTHTGAATVGEGGFCYVREYSADSGLLEIARSEGEAALAESGNSLYSCDTVTCDQVIFSREYREELRRTFHADAVEMEGAAVAQVASMHGCPFLAVRAISDEIDLDIRGLERLTPARGESRPARWWKKASFIAAHPGELRKAGPLLSGLRIASQNSALVACAVARKI